MVIIIAVLYDLDCVCVWHCHDKAEAHCQADLQYKVFSKVMRVSCQNLFKYRIAQASKTKEVRNMWTRQSTELWELAEIKNCTSPYKSKLLVYLKKIEIKASLSTRYLWFFNDLRLATFVQINSLHLYMYIYIYIYVINMYNNLVPVEIWW
jgi:hypothetical protein